MVDVSMWDANSEAGRFSRHLAQRLLEANALAKGEGVPDQLANAITLGLIEFDRYKSGNLDLG